MRRGQNQGGQRAERARRSSMRGGQGQRGTVCTTRRTRYMQRCAPRVARTPYLVRRTRPWSIDEVYVARSLVEFQISPAPGLHKGKTGRVSCKSDKILFHNCHSPLFLACPSLRTCRRSQLRSSQRGSPFNTFHSNRVVVDVDDAVVAAFRDAANKIFPAHYSYLDLHNRRASGSHQGRSCGHNKGKQVGSHQERSCGCECSKPCMCQLSAPIAQCPWRGWSPLWHQT